jgi:hypothetical protein
MTRLAFLALIAIPSAAQNASPPLDAKASDPVVMGWMVGSPPPANKIIRFSDSTFFRFPQTRWSYSNIRQLMPTRVVARGDAPAVPLPRAEQKDLDGIRFHPLGSTDWMKWAQSLDANYTDGVLVLHKGRVVYERYFGALSAEKQHLAFSVTKSFVGTLAAALISEGVLDEKASVSRYVPQLKNSGFADATLRHLLDMTTGMPPGLPFPVTSGIASLPSRDHTVFIEGMVRHTPRHILFATDHVRTSALRCLFDADADAGGGPPIPATRYPTSTPHPNGTTRSDVSLATVGFGLLSRTTPAWPATSTPSTPVAPHH